LVARVRGKVLLHKISAEMIAKTFYIHWGDLLLYRATNEPSRWSDPLKSVESVQSVVKFVAPDRSHHAEAVLSSISSAVRFLC